MQRHPDLTRALALAGQGRNDEALEIIERLADAGDPGSLFTLGDAYWRGMLVPRNPKRALNLFGRASDAGHPMAVRAFTNLLANGRGGRRDWGAALDRLEEEAPTDGRRAQMLGLIRAMSLTPSGDPTHVPPAESLSTSPQVAMFRGAFSPAECDFLMMSAEPTYERSRVVDLNGDVPALIRTSDGSTIHWLIEDPAIHALNRRLAGLTGTNVDQGEPLQILRYRPGQEYRPHVDWLPGDNPRIMTALVYLNDDFTGGETAFAEVGLRVKGRKGDVLVFRSQGPDGGLDPLSIHAGLPVTSGTKYLASRWIRASQHGED